VVRLPDAAARRRCEATLRTGRLVTPHDDGSPTGHPGSHQPHISSELTWLFPVSKAHSLLPYPTRRPGRPVLSVQRQVKVYLPPITRFEDVRCRERRRTVGDESTGGGNGGGFPV
jgi:hypothetical protein